MSQKVADVDEGFDVLGAGMWSARDGFNADDACCGSVAVWELGGHGFTCCGRGGLMEGVGLSMFGGL